MHTANLPVILTGDFNCPPEEEPYRVLTVSESGLTDACVVAGSSQDFVEGTFNGFGSEKNPKRIDMVFYNEGWKADSYKVMKIKEGEMFVSDHWPIVVELNLKD
jgi:endonuclease/exonuclease/phosphatase family metal-dependent hydrolase